MKASSAFKSPPAHDWTAERVEQLSAQDIQQLRENAERLGKTEVVALCDGALKTRRTTTSKRGAATPRQTRRLISRSNAFQARGVYLVDASASWSGVRRSDSVVVMGLWAKAVVSSEGSCSQLLYAPNVDGSRPWSETASGKERLEHCKLALQSGSAEGLLIYGEPLEGFLPEHKARSVYGVDPELVVRFQVERRGDEYWAVWGAKAAERSI